MTLDDGVITVWPPFRSRIVGRKRSIISDTLSLLLTALVTVVSVQDATANQPLLNSRRQPHITRSALPLSMAATADTSPSMLLPPSASISKSSNAPPGDRGFHPGAKTPDVRLAHAPLSAPPRLRNPSLPARLEAPLWPTSWYAASPARTPPLDAPRHHRIKPASLDEKMRENGLLGRVTNIEHVSTISRVRSQRRREPAPTYPGPLRDRRKITSNQVT